MPSASRRELDRQHDQEHEREQRDGVDAVGQRGHVAAPGRAPTAAAPATRRRRCRPRSTAPPPAGPCRSSSVDRKAEHAACTGRGSAGTGSGCRSPARRSRRGRPPGTAAAASRPPLRSGPLRERKKGWPCEVSRAESSHPDNNVSPSDEAAAPAAQSHAAASPPGTTSRAGARAPPGGATAWEPLRRKTELPPDSGDRSGAGRRTRPRPHRRTNAVAQSSAASDERVQATD